MVLLLLEKLFYVWILKNLLSKIYFKKWKRRKKAHAILFDLEVTAGTNPNIGAYSAVENLYFSSLVKLQCQIHPYVSQNVHHITNQMVSDQPLFHTVWKNFLMALLKLQQSPEDIFLIGHHVASDIALLVS